MRGDITVAGALATQVAFKNCASPTKCITMIDGTITDDAGELDLVMPILRYATIAVPLNYLSNFWRSPGMPLIDWH